MSYLRCHHAPKKRRGHTPVIGATLQLKWGLALLGEEKATQYLMWLHKKLKQTKTS